MNYPDNYTIRTHSSTPKTTTYLLSQADQCWEETTGVTESVLANVPRGHPALVYISAPISLHKTL
jgi:hypothetical protein